MDELAVTGRCPGRHREWRRPKHAGPPGSFGRPQRQGHTGSDGLPRGSAAVANCTAAGEWMWCLSAIAVRYRIYELRLWATPIERQALIAPKTLGGDCICFVYGIALPLTVEDAGVLDDYLDYAQRWSGKRAWSPAGRLRGKMHSVELRDESALE